jgi:hypothetical protein
MDKVTISFYSKEIDTQPGYTQNFLAEIVNIKKIRDGLLKKLDVILPNLFYQFFLYPIGIEMVILTTTKHI